MLPAEARLVQGHKGHSLTIRLTGASSQDRLMVVSMNTLLPPLSANKTLGILISVKLMPSLLLLSLVGIRMEILRVQPDHGVNDISAVSYTHLTLPTSVYV